MDLREQIHSRIDELPEAELKRLARQLEVPVKTKAEDLAETLALWEELAAPMTPEDSAEFADAIKRRPFFGEREFSVEPD